jgi:hypothetical protein
LILDTARRLDEEHVVKQDQICRKIKELLEDKIQETKISEGWIEECLPTEYKRKYKVKPKSQLNHLLKHRPELQIAVIQDGKSEMRQDETSPQVIKYYTEQQGIKGNPYNRIKELEDENREMDVRCSLAESSNSELVLKLTTNEKEIEKLREEEHDLSDLPDKYGRQGCGCRELEEEVIELSEILNANA